MAGKKHRNKPRRERGASSSVAGSATPGGHSSRKTSAPANAPAWLSAPWVAPGVLCLLIAVSYFPATQAGFVWDDAVLSGAKPLQNLSGLWQIWFEPRSLKEYEGHYWPVLYTTFWLEHRLWGLHPLGYHLVNLLLHMGVTLLLWRLLLRLAMPVAWAWAAAAVFAVHPLHVESVVWVMGRKDLLAAGFYLGAVLYYLRFAEHRRRADYARALALFMLSLLSKSIAVTLPVALLLWHWWKRGRVIGADFARALPFLLLGLGVTVIDWLAYKDVEEVSLDYSSLERVLIAAQALWFYAGKLLWPAGLVVVYPHWEVGADHLPAWGYFIAAVAVAALLWFYRQRITRAPLAAAAFFAVTLSPTLGFVDYGYMQFSFVADRYQYLAGAGIIALAVGAVAWGAQVALSRAWKGAQPMALAMLALVPLIPLSVATWQHAGIYRNEGVFFAHITNHNPRARSAHYNLGGWLKNEERHEEALAAYRAALGNLDPDNPGAAVSTHINMGVVHEGLEEYEQAEEYYRLALQAKPRSKNALHNLARLLTGNRQYDESLALYRKLLKIDPDYMKAYAGMAATLVWLERPGEALHNLERALELDPSRQELGSAREQLDKMQQEVEQHGQRQLADTHYRRALEHRKQGRLEEALAALRKSREQSPDSVEIHATLGFVAEEMNRLDQAAAHYQRALEIDPRFPEALNHLGALRLRQQRYTEALTHFQTLIEIQPDFAKVYSGMGVALFNLNRSEEAVRSFDKALSLDPGLEEARVNRDYVLQILEGGGG